MPHHDIILSRNFTMTLGDWRDLSLILLALEGMLVALIYGVIFYVLWKGLRIAHQWLRTIGLPEGNRYALLARQYTQELSQRIVRPFVQVEATLAQLSTFFHALAAFMNKTSRR